MAGRTSKPKQKKPLETTLGQAPKENLLSEELEKPDDLSQLQQPINTSICGISQLLNVFTTATNEVKDYLQYECDIVYECRNCRNLFRSFANFILHKRTFCKDKYKNNVSRNQAPSGAVVTLEKEETFKTSEEISEEPKLDDQGIKKADKKSIAPIIENLLKKHDVPKEFQNQKQRGNQMESNDVILISDGNNIVLETIDTSDNAKFQTFIKTEEGAAQKQSKESLMKNEVLEIHNILEGTDVFMAQNGTITTENRGKNSCPNCNYSFSSRKTLLHHIKSKHMANSIIYPCPNCQDTFANCWNVYRHLFNVHKLSASQVRKLRPQVFNSAIPKDQQPELKKPKEVTKITNKLSEEDEWMAHFEQDGLLQMCGGCGKKFERKAALNSHSHMCLKRLNACRAKVKKIEDKPVVVPKGSAKRKPMRNPHRIMNTVFEEKDEDSGKVSAESNEEALKISSSLPNTGKKKPDAQISGESEEPFTIEDSSNSNSDYKMERENGNGTESNNNENGTEEESPMKKITLRKKVVTVPKCRNIINKKQRIEKRKKPDIIPEENMKASVKEETNEDEDKTQILKDLSSRLKGVRIIPSKAKPKETQQMGEEQKNVDDPLQEDIKQDSLIIHFKKLSDQPNYEVIEIRNSESRKSDESVKNSEETTNLKINEILEEVIISDDEDVSYETTVPSKSPEKREETHRLEHSHSDSPPKLMNEYSEFLNDETDYKFFQTASKFMDLNSLKCIPCQESFTSRTMLLMHMSLHFSWFRYQCSKCPFMAYSKYDCFAHATKRHRISASFVQNTILPIPDWKVLSMTHPFKNLPLDSGKRKMSFYPGGNVNRKMPRLEPMLDLKPGENSIEPMKHQSEKEENSSDSNRVESSPEETKKKTETDTRPVRNRLRSVKTLSEDFIYDLGKVLKFNDNAIRSLNKGKK